ncbi:hypothetical protein KO494_13090 [Lacinutrix sp. C3R15]|uniref:hypothetical protein n=1 Tax=Flavobacteriaceae TaxID=49546 RepID=UPI001C097626|nr:MULTISPECIES: hypothetical protein [Flavobacteriaceae]MBU2940476.1 hypothetical protein [Lacinutrix sp. C3R15]MDO6623796.1 hypothetical protein [Oceanihabitans sp. 1_MG-2023]
MKKFVSILILGISLVSCSADDETVITNEDTELEYPSITGKWNMVSSCGGIADDCWYSTGDYTKMVEFKNNLEYVEKINNIIEVESTYLITDTLFIANRAIFKIEFGFDYTSEFTFISDTLSIVRGDYWENHIRVTE